MNEEWVAVTDRLPDEKGSYWITTVDGTVHLGFMKPDGTAFRRSGVVAWMPHPQTPEPARFTVTVLPPNSRGL